MEIREEKEKKNKQADATQRDYCQSKREKEQKQITSLFIAQRNPEV